jgi:hypothetical protein
MADVLRDFQYYADKTEQAIRASRTGKGLDATKLELTRAEIYARLAAAAPRFIACTAFKHGEIAFERKYRCALRAGHEGDHRTDDGVNFTL